MNHHTVHIIQEMAAKKLYTLGCQMPIFTHLLDIQGTLKINSRSTSFGFISLEMMTGYLCCQKRNASVEVGV